jgi:hypothetical protein
MPNPFGPGALIQGHLSAMRFDEIPSPMAGSFERPKKLSLGIFYQSKILASAAIFSIC